MAKRFHQKLEFAKTPYLFSEYFSRGREESISPFLTQESRSWAKNLSLRSSILSAFLLFFAFVSSFFSAFVPLSNLLLMLVYLISGIPALIAAIEDIFTLEINIDVLMVLAAFLSVIIDSSMEGGLLLVLFAISGSMEKTVMGKATSALHDLHNLSPTMAWVKNAKGYLKKRSTKDIKIGDEIIVKAGEMIPLDGDIIEGRASLNLSHLTGEQVPVMKELNDNVPAGAYNLDGLLSIKVTRLSSDSTVARIIALIREAQAKKPAMQRWFDRFSKGYAITIISLSFLFAIIIPFFAATGFLGVEGSIYRALTFLIAASPCALIIAVPIAYLSAISACAKKGIILKGGITLDAIAKCNLAAFDKTGTLTTSELTLLDIHSIEKKKFNFSQILSIAYTLEKNATHPIATAIVTHAEESNLQSLKLDSFEAFPGLGLKGRIEFEGKNLNVAIGHENLIKEIVNESNFSLLLDSIKGAKEKGIALTTLIINQEIYLLYFSDKLRQETHKLIKDLKSKCSINPIILSGDHEASVKRIANELGIDEFYGDLTPNGKLEMVSRLSEKEGLLMVGDGINDAPALARATCGLSMGQLGSTTAVDASDAILLNDHLEPIPWLLRKAKKTQGIVRENIVLAGLIIVTISIPALLGFIPLWLAVVLHEGGTILVGLNSLRLLR